MGVIDVIELVFYYVCSHGFRATDPCSVVHTIRFMLLLFLFTQVFTGDVSSKTDGCSRTAENRFETVRSAASSAQEFGHSEPTHTGSTTQPSEQNKI